MMPTFHLRARQRPSTLAIGRGGHATVALVVPLLLLTASGGCGALMGIAGYPPEALRNSKPVGIDARGRQVGAMTQRTTLPDQDGASIAFGGPSETETLLLFYRGHW